jgi:hypothetical protein
MNNANLPDYIVSALHAKPWHAVWCALGLEPSDSSQKCETLYVVEWADGTGQAWNVDAGRHLYVEGVPFENEPSGHVDPGYYHVTRVM